MIQKEKLTHLEQAIMHIKHMTDEEKITLAKFLALDQGVRMYTPQDVAVLIQREIARQQANSLVLRVGH